MALSKGGGMQTAEDFGTVPGMVKAQAARWSDRIILRQKDLGIWHGQTWAELDATCDAIAAGLATLGMVPGDMVSILANTSREWLWVDLGAQYGGAIVSGVYPTDSADQLRYMCLDSGTRFLFVEDEEQLDKFLERRADLPDIHRVIVFDMKGLRDLDDPAILSLDDLIAAGRAAGRPAALASRSPADPAMLVYTSGTTGAPKGAVITHGNAVFAAVTLRDFFPPVPRGERLSFLPMCHVSERIIGAYSALAMGHVLNFVEHPDTVFENLREVQPDVFMAVPRVWEKIYSAAAIALKEGTAFQRACADAAMAVGRRQAAARAEGRRPGALSRLWARGVQRVALGNLRRQMGLDRVRFAATGAAPISPDLLRWFDALGIEILELWGMSELTGAATINPPGGARIGSIGKPLPGTELRLSDQNEIMVRGPQVFAGYHGLAEKTAETFDGEWLKTGDVGRRDEDGYYYIVDRIKDIIITAGGKNITPSEWENQLKFSPYVTDAVMIGDRRKFPTCLVMIDQENVENWAQDQRIEFSDFRSLTRHPQVIELIDQEVSRANAGFARVEQVKAFRLIEVQLSAEDEELTPTMKLKRKLVEKKYAALVEDMYKGG
ncbi:AMP-dependent synthetase/ligase [Pseudooceanicola aestuarii]|uniref:AMP-dependent synthetase/ligase n=1 Tax=Pseudooceanicola aestuarii TaxID=2697319 RepID=UPI0013D3BB45|nr:AMP-dependent synthetase/ligase [Pseudooceanicola aestuarii]